VKQSFIFYNKKTLTFKCAFADSDDKIMKSVACIFFNDYTNNVHMILIDYWSFYDVEK